MTKQKKFRDSSCRLSLEKLWSRELLMPVFMHESC